MTSEQTETGIGTSSHTGKTLSHQLVANLILCCSPGGRPRKLWRENKIREKKTSAAKYWEFSHPIKCACVHTHNGKKGVPVLKDNMQNLNEG